MPGDHPFDGDLRSDEEPPDFAGVRDRVVGELVVFVRALRDAGVAVPANAALVGARALVEVGFSDETRARAALRAVFVSRAADWPAFERGFDAFWRRLGSDPTGESLTKPGEGLVLPGQPAESESAEPHPSDVDDTDLEAGEDDPIERPAPVSDDDTDAETATTAEEGSRAIFSPQGRGDPVSPDDVPGVVDEHVDLAMNEVADVLASLRGRRWEQTGRDRPNVRRALRASLETGGTVLSVPRRDRARDAVSALFLVDVSQSVLDTVDRGFLVAVLRDAVTRFRSTEVVLFDTDVQRVTEAMDAESADVALAALADAETEWGGGTQIGGALSAVREQYPRAVDRNTVVFVVSDGLETGDVDELERGMAWLSRRAATLLWLNPLAGSPAYEPTAQGMAAAKPYVDGLFAFSGPADLHEVARQLRRQGPGGRIGYEYAPDI